MTLGFTSRSWIRRSLAAALIAALPALAGAEGDGCAANSTSPAPEVSGEWAIAYDNQLDVEIRIGGAVYNETLPETGGSFVIVHDGLELAFDLDCSRPEIVCPSEAWPETVTVEQRNAELRHQMIVTLPTQRCDGALRTPDAGECGPGTNNPDCEQVCEGPVSVSSTERFGVIGETGETFRLFLGAGIATNGFNCALLAFSLADADLISEGEPGDRDWTAVEMAAGLVTVGYAGGCLWAGDPDMDGELEALLAGASVTFQTGFTGDRL
jgi:hypothetical protein